jgi:4-amino-4-deoxy-L-arabinose transferase-like glycosyltransferase
VLGAVLALAALLAPRELILGSNSVGARLDVAEIPANGRMCIRDQLVPSRTGRIRMKIDSQTRRQPPYAVTVRGFGLTLHGATMPGPPGADYVDLPISPVVPDAPAGAVRMDICVRAGNTGGPVYPWGTAQLDNTSKPLVVRTNSGVREFPNRVGLWYLPPQEERRTLLAQAPDIARRASLFRPRIIGPWTFALVLLVAAPGLVYAGLRLLGLSSTRRRLRLGGAARVGLIGVGVALTWAVVTPAFQSPDESEHFAAVQWFAETGKATDAQQGARGPWSSDEAIAIDATRELSVIERTEANLPWLAVYEDAYRESIAKQRPPRDDGGGFHPVTSGHSPLYYAVTSPAYLLTRDASVFTQLFAMRVTSAIMAGLTAMLAALLILELLPGRRTLAVAGGLMVAFQPMFSFIGGAVNNDNGVNLFAAATLYLAVRALRRGLTPRVAALLGLALAVTPLMKGTGYAVYPAVGLALAGALFRRHSRGHLLGAGTFVLAFGAAYLGWDLVRESFGRTQFTTPGGGTPGVSFGALDYPRAYLVWLWQILLPVKLPFMQDFTLVKWPFYNIYVERGFGSYGWYAIEFPAWVYLSVVGVMGGVVALGIAALWRLRDIVRRRLWELAVLVAVPVCVFLGVEAAYFTLVIPIDGTPEQGRYIFTAIGALAAIVVLATLGAGRRSAVPIATALVSALMVLTFAGQLLTLSAFYT